MRRGPPFHPATEVRCLKVGEHLWVEGHRCRYDACAASAQLLTRPGCGILSTSGAAQQLRPSWVNSTRPARPVETSEVRQGADGSLQRGERALSADFV